MVNKKVNKSKGRIFLPILFLFTGSIFLFTFCRHEETGFDALETVCFVRDVLPVFRASCGVTGCHDQQTATEGYVFTDYAGILKGVVP